MITPEVLRCRWSAWEVNQEKKLAISLIFVIFVPINFEVETSEQSLNSGMGMESACRSWRFQSTLKQLQDRKQFISQFMTSKVNLFHAISLPF